MPMHNAWNGSLRFGIFTGQCQRLVAPGEHGATIHAKLNKDY
jgi:hypothetical protein